MVEKSWSGKHEVGISGLLPAAEGKTNFTALAPAQDAVLRHMKSKTLDESLMLCFQVSLGEVLNADSSQPFFFALADGRKLVVFCVVLF